MHLQETMHLHWPNIDHRNDTQHEPFHLQLDSIQLKFGPLNLISKKMWDLNFTTQKKIKISLFNIISCHKSFDHAINVCLNVNLKLKTQNADQMDQNKMTNPQKLINLKDTISDHQPTKHLMTKKDKHLVKDSETTKNWNMNPKPGLKQLTEYATP